MKKAGFFAAALMLLVTGCDSNNSYSSNQNDYNNYSYTPSTTATTTTVTTTTAATESTRSIEELKEHMEQVRQETVANAVAVSFEDLARDKNGMEGECIVVTGQIAQVIESDYFYEGLISITYVYDEFLGLEYFTDEILYKILKADCSSRLLEGDIVTFWGKSDGLYTYTSVANTSVTLPQIYVMVAETY